MNLEWINPYALSYLLTTFIFGILFDYVGNIENN